jgi:soluble lytic murein transglycosylase-like protein
MFKRFQNGAWAATLAGAGLWLGVCANAQADLYVYELPNGTRIITDHALANKDYKLIRRSTTGKGSGALASRRYVSAAANDPKTYDRLLARAATKHNVDPVLLKAVMHVESAFNPHAVSHRGAMGLMQLMPDTAARYGVEDAFDPVQNVHGAARYLQDLHRQFRNNIRYVIAAYNAGENAVRRHNGIPPYDETQEYVKKVLAMHRYYLAESKKTAPQAPAAIRASQPVTPAVASAAAPL